LDEIKGLFVNRNYRPVAGLKPWHGFLLFACVIALSMILILSFGRALNEKLESGDISELILYTHLPLFLLGLIFTFGTRMKWSDLKLRSLSLLNSLWAIGLSVFAFAGAIFILGAVLILHQLLAPQLLEESMEQIQALNNAMLPSTPGGIFKTLMLLALLPAIVEEFLYRGLMMQAFMRWGPIWAILLSSIAFGISHEMLLRIPSLIFVGIVLGMFKYITGNLSASILMHFLYNTMVISLGVLAQDFVGAG
jgi:membrane protease YdiL (CAAX protease family)